MLGILVAEAADKDDSLFTVFAEGRGENRLKALDNAIDEALRKCTGTLLLSREELIDNSLREKVIQASQGSIKKTEILPGEYQKDGLTILTAKVHIDPKLIVEKTALKNEGRGLDVKFYESPLLDYGANSIYNFFQSLNLLDFIDVSLTEPPKIEDNALKFSI